VDESAQDLTDLSRAQILSALAEDFLSIYSAFQSTLNSPIVSYRIVSVDNYCLAYKQIKQLDTKITSYKQYDLSD